MPVQAVGGGDRPRDRQYPRQPGAPRAGGPGTGTADPGFGQQQEREALLYGRARVLVDEDQRILFVQLLDNGGQVVQEISADDLAGADYHGILVDIET